LLLHAILKIVKPLKKRGEKNGKKIVDIVEIPKKKSHLMEARNLIKIEDLIAGNPYQILKKNVSLIKKNENRILWNKK
jgi:hypothetical protein